ncbi:hypothetical protein D9M71_514450 [compost metagenome]
MAKIFTEALLSPQAEELLRLRAKLLIQLAARPDRILVVTDGTHGQQWHLHFAQPPPPIALGITKAAKQAEPAQAFQCQPNGLIFRPAFEPGTGDLAEPLEQQARAPLHRWNFQRPISAADLTAEQGGTGHLSLPQVVPAQCRCQGDAAQGMTEPVRRLATLLTDEGADDRQVIAGVVSDAILAVVMVAWRQPMPTHFRNPHIETGTRQVCAQADAPG